MEIRGRRVRIIPPAGARSLIADTTAWRYAPLPLAGPLELVLPRRAYFEYAFLDEKDRPFADPEATETAENPWYPYAAAVRLEGALQPFAGVAELSGKVRRLRIGKRHVVVYEPPRPPRACLLVFDGVAYYRIAKLAHVAERLWRLGRISALRVVFSEPLNRDEDYRFSDELRRHVLREVVPEVTARFGGVALRGLWGASLGGLAALWLGLEHGEVFSRVGAQSAALKAVVGGSDAWRDPEWLLQRYRESAAELDMVALQAGKIEWLLGAARRFAAALADRGTPHEYREYPSGHNWYTWRLGLAEGLEDLFGVDLE